MRPVNTVTDNIAMFLIAILRVPHQPLRPQLHQQQDAKMIWAESSLRKYTVTQSFDV